MAPRVGAIRNCKKCRDFEPHAHWEQRVPNARIIFVCSMGDLFCLLVPDAVIERVIVIVQGYPDRDFLFCTKNPSRYYDFLDLFTPNCILGTTIETNRDDIYPRSNAPLPSERYEAFVALDYPRKFLSVEPVMEFDLAVLFEWIKTISPCVCEIGYDNYPERTRRKMGSYLPEPSQRKVRKLIELKQKAGIDTREKTIRKAWWES